jgi:hypothetical protein
MQIQYAYRMNTTHPEFQLRVASEGMSIRRTEPAARATATIVGLR